MLEKTPTGTRENGPYDMWDKCLKESKKIELKYIEINGEKKHLAPNGEVSKLPELYAKITRTPTFLNWFGDWTQSNKTNVSKVVYEETDEPMLVFHGTKKFIQPEDGLRPILNEFDDAKSGKVFFSGNISGIYRNMELTFNENTNEQIFQSFLNIKKPYIGHPKYAPFLFFKDGYLTRESDRFYAAATSAKQIMHLPSSIENNPTKI